MKAGNLAEAVERRFPALFSRIRAAGIESIDIGSLQNVSVDWDALLKRWVESLDLKSGTAIAVSGFGDGSHIKALLRALPKGSYVFCGEAKTERLLAACSREEALSLLEDERLFVGCGDLDQDFFESLTRFPLLEVQSASAVIFAPLFNEAPDYYGTFFTEFARAFEYWRKLYGTNVTASGKWQSNTLQNLPLLAEAPDLSLFDGYFGGKTMILVSAGPSLDESLEFVRRHSDRCVVVAVNSSYRAVRNAGVTPQFVLAADPYRYTDKGFAGVRCEGTVLLCPYIVYPDVAQRFKGRVATWSGGNLLASYARSKMGRSQGTSIAEMGTVSACAFDLAERFGCERLIFVGQDLAAKEDGQSHASDTFYEDMSMNTVDTGSCRRLPGNTIATVPVDENLHVYLKVFESLARERAGVVELVNTSRLGARIEGIPYRSLAEVDAVLEDEGMGAGSVIDQTAIASMLSDASSEGSACYEAVSDELYGFAEKLCSLSLRGALAIEECSEGEVDANVAQNARKELLAHIGSDEAAFAVIKDGALKYELMVYARSQQREEVAMEALGAELHNLREYFWAVAEGSFSFLRALDLRDDGAGLGSTA